MKPWMGVVLIGLSLGLLMKACDDCEHREYYAGTSVCLD